MREADDGRQVEPEPSEGDGPYEPPRAEEIASEGRAATAAWIATPGDDKN
jgi:hypothetical protein